MVASPDNDGVSVELPGCLHQSVCRRGVAHLRIASDAPEEIVSLQEGHIDDGLRKGRSR